MRIDRGNTNNPNPPRSDNQDGFRRIARFRVIAYVTDYGGSSPRTDLVSAHRYNGHSIGTTVYVVKVSRSDYAAGDDLWAVLPDGKTDLTYAKDGTHSAVPVLWMDVGGGVDSVFDAIIRSNTSGHYTIDLGHWGTVGASTGGSFISDTGSTGAYTAFCPILVLPVGTVCQVVSRSSSANHYTVIQQAREELCVITGTHSVFSSSIALGTATYLATVHSTQTFTPLTITNTRGASELYGDAGGSANYFVNLSEIGTGVAFGSHKVGGSFGVQAAWGTKWGLASDGIPIYVGALSPLVDQQTTTIISVSGDPSGGGSVFSVPTTNTFTVMGGVYGGPNSTILLPNTTGSPQQWTVDATVNFLINITNQTNGSGFGINGTFVTVQGALYDVNGSSNLSTFARSTAGNTLPASGTMTLNTEDTVSLRMLNTVGVGSKSTLTLGIILICNNPISGSLTSAFVQAVSYVIRGDRVQI